MCLEDIPRKCNEDIIVPQHCSTDETSTTHLVPHRPSQDTDKKHIKTLDILNPLPKRMQPVKSTVLDQTNTSDLASTLGSKKGSRRGQNNYNGPIRKVQLNNNNNNNCSRKDGSLQSAAKKGILLQRTWSYEKEKEFALALCKKLNENLKVGKTMLPSGSDKQQKPVPLKPISRSESTLSAPQRKDRIPGSSVDQQAQHSAEKVDKLPNEERSESPSCQATTPSGKLSLKRRREASSDGKKEVKRFCHTTPTSGSVIYSEVHNISSPPKYVKSAILKTSGNKGSLTLEDRKRTTTSISFSGARQLFIEPDTEPKSESANHLLTNVSGLGQLNEEIKHSKDRKFQVGNLLSADTSASYSCKLNQKYSDEGSSSASTHTSLLPNLMDEVKISSPVHQSECITPAYLGFIGSEKDETKTSEEDPDSSPRASLPSTPTRHDEEKRRGIVWKDPLDFELDDENLGQESSAVILSSSGSSEDEQLPSLQEFLKRSAHVPNTPEKGAFSEPSTPVFKTAPKDVKTKVASYKNTMEQMLKEKRENQKSKELELQLLQACKEDPLKLEEDEENENTEAALSNEQREFLQKFSVTSCAIREIHPGEEVFTLANFGRLFNHLSLDLSQTGVTPNNRAQLTLLQAPTENVLLLLNAGLFRRAYSTSPCQPQVTHWLFQMMSVHPNPSTCAQILQTMNTLALSAARHIVEKSNKMFEVWVPSIKEVALVFLNMGVSFVNLFPLEALQPSFTEGDLLESLQILPDGATTEKEHNLFPEHNFENIVKYLVLCTALCPSAYTDEELLLLLVQVCKVSLETCLQLLPTGDISCLLQHVLNNMTHWEIQLPQVCQTITDLTDDHHNLRRLVQLLPYCVRGKQLRRHLSVSAISKLLNHRCTYRPSCTEFQLSDLRRYIPRMRPSSLLKGFIVARKEQQESDDCAPTPDQQAYYLCYSLLALANEASNFEFLPSNQRNELLLLSSELEKHIKCDIRENEKMLYRSKVKDFVARIYTRWQVLLQRSRPQEGKLYDYWKPLPEDEMPVNDHLNQETTKESQSEDSDSAHSDDEDWVEEEDEVPVKSEEELEECLGESKEKKDRKVLSDIKLEEELLKLNNKDEKEDESGNNPVDEDLLEGEDPEELIGSDVEDELLEDEENGDIMRRENDELNKIIF